MSSSTMTDSYLPSPSVYRGQTLNLSTPPISASRLLPTLSSWPGRKFYARPIVQHPSKFYGDAVILKALNTTRIFFQNVKGLTHTTSQEDSYRYYIFDPTFTLPYADLTNRAKWFSDLQVRI